MADAIAACLQRSRRMKPVMAALEWGGSRRGSGASRDVCGDDFSTAPSRRSESPEVHGRDAPGSPHGQRSRGARRGVRRRIFVHGSGDPALLRLVDAVGVLGQLWVAALRMTVLPLVIALTLLAIVGAGRKSRSGLSA